eukprot:scaffold26859_cov134-Isochrysis_galbana.AAC.4
MSRFSAELSRHHARPITDIGETDGDELHSSGSQMRRSHAAVHTSHPAPHPAGMGAGQPSATNGAHPHPAADWPAWTDAASSDVADAKASPGVDAEGLDAHLDSIELYVPPLTSFLLHSTYRDLQVRHRDLSAPARKARMPAEEAAEAGLPREGVQACTGEGSGRGSRGSEGELPGTAQPTMG